MALLRVEGKVCDIDHSFPVYDNPLSDIGRVTREMHRDIGAILDLRTRISTGQIGMHDLIKVEGLCRRYSAPVEEVALGVYDQLSGDVRKDIDTRYAMIRSLLKLTEH